MEISDKPFSFSMSKTATKSKVCHVKLPESLTNKDNNTDYVTSISDTKIESSKPLIQEVEQVVIPLIKSKKSILKRENQTNNVLNANSSDPLVNQALEELKAEAKEWDNESSGQHSIFSQPITSLTITNTDNNNSDSEDPEDANYESVSIVDFGTAMLRGMGWKPDDKKKNSKPKDVYIRPKGLGLGADPNVLKKALQAQSKNSSKNEEELVWKTGAYSQIIMGRHASLYGIIESIDGDDGRVFFRTSVSKEVLNIPQHSVKLVNQVEYQKYSKYINKIQADSYKKVSDERMAREAQMKSEYVEKSHKRKSSDIFVKSEREPDKKPKHSSHKKEECSNSEANGRYWVLPGIRVRLIDKNFLRGKYYKEKMKVIDVVSRGICNCQTDEGRLVEGVPFKYLETVVPKVVDSSVMIVRGEHSGQKGKLIEKRSNKEEAVILIDDEQTVVVLSFDDFSEKV